MKTFAFLTHSRLKTIWPFKRLVKSDTPFKISKIKNVRSTLGKEIEGFIINLPLDPDQLTDLEEQFIQDRIIAATNKAYELGAEILGLGGIFAEKKYNIDGKFKLPVTNGDSFSAWTVVEAIYRAVKLNKIVLKESSIAVIGPSKPVGFLCAMALSSYASGVTVSGGPQTSLTRFKEIINNKNLFVLFN